MNRRFKLMVLVLVIVLLISSMSVLLTSCNTPKYYASLEQAYAEGKISRQDLMSSAYYWPFSNIGEDFVPTPINPKELDEKTQEKIINMFLNEKGLVGNDPAGIPYKNYIDDFLYLGTYDNIIICAIVIDTIAQDWDSIEIDGVEFRGPGGLRLIAIELW